MIGFIRQALLAVAVRSSTGTTPLRLVANKRIFDNNPRLDNGRGFFAPRPPVKNKVKHMTNRINEGNRNRRTRGDWPRE